MLKSTEILLALVEKEHLSLPGAIVRITSQLLMMPEPEIRSNMKERLLAMKQSTDEARENSEHLKIECFDSLPFDSNTMSGEFVLYAAETAMFVAKYNATMGRIVAAPTAGSCGILPGMFAAWDKFKNSGAEEERIDRLTDALIVASAIGDVIASRATLAGAEGGCQAECGSAAAMGASALAWLQGATPKACMHAAALAIKSILGLACDPVAGLVECPCIKRNGMLVANGILAADLATAGIESIIPLDEVIDAMKEIGQMLPPAIRETSCGGLATTATARELTKKMYGA